MSSNGKSDHLRLGFLTAIEVPEKGFVGGLLVTTQSGRPLEFQCTTPVKPNGTQKILYGPTLEPFVLGELIGATLVEKAGVKPQWILTDRESFLELRNHIEQPVACLADLEGSAPAEAAGRVIHLGKQKLRLHAAHDEDEAAMTGGSSHLPPGADLQEPFERVREALQETLRSGALK